MEAKRLGKKEFKTFYRSILKFIHFIDRITDRTSFMRYLVSRKWGKQLSSWRYGSFGLPCLFFCRRWRPSVGGEGREGLKIWRSSLTRITIGPLSVVPLLIPLPASQRYHCRVLCPYTELFFLRPLVPQERYLYPSPERLRVYPPSPIPLTFLLR